MKENAIGIVLSEANSKEAPCQLFESAEKGEISEGMLLIVQSQDNSRRILARVGEIVPFNAFYTEGDPWSEARRKNLPLPEDVARRYEICRLELLIEFRAESGAEEITNPPRPGDYVYRYDPREHEGEVFGVTRSDPGFVWFGTQVGYSNAPIPLDVEQIPTHLAIFGVTGSGKSFDLGGLIEQLATIPTGPTEAISYPLLIIDAHGDYLDYVTHCARNKSLGAISTVTRYVFPKAYTRLRASREAVSLKPIGINLDLLTPRDLSEIIVQFYKGSGGETSELQVHGIAELLQQMSDQGYESRNGLFSTSYQDLLRQLAQSQTLSPPTKAAIQRAFEKFKANLESHSLISDANKSPLGTAAFVDELTKHGQMLVVDFSAEGAPGVDLPTKQMIITYLAALLFERFTYYKTQDDTRYLLFVLEEAQNFCPDQSYPIGASLAKVKLSAIATQGRKFGLSLCLVSQRPSFVDRIVLSMCNTFFIHRISPEDVSFVKSVSGGLPTSLAPRLTKMARGEMIVTGQMSKVPFPLVIRGIRTVPPTVGKTEVLKRLMQLRLGEEVPSKRE